MDRQIQVVNTPPDNTSLFISLQFKKSQCLTTKLRWTASLQIGNGQPYTESLISRRTIFVYNPLTTVYMLVNYDCVDIKIYVMQSINNQNNSNISTLNAQYLSEKLILPPGWFFTVMNLDKDTYLKVVSTDTAKLVTDSLGNSYQYLNKKYAPWIYDNYPKNI